MKKVAQRNKTIQSLLTGRVENHLMPFFWQHGEDEATLREYMAAIDGANCHAVCVESRPHPDFCGPKWWADMDVILDEARKRSMKVWILDDSHFPTGFANGAMRTQPDRLCRQSVFLRACHLGADPGQTRLNLRELGLLAMPEKEKTGIAAFLNAAPARVFDDDSILSVTAVLPGNQRVDLTDRLAGGVLVWQKPRGEVELQVCVRTRNAGPHRDYINMTDPESCRILIDAVYEPHWRHYGADFGKTIAGFFSDEPELGSNELYVKYNRMGCDQDLPWSAPVEEKLRQRLGSGWRVKLPLLWGESTGPEAASVRTAYMDVVTRQVETAFSRQIGDWCREHGVRYIGHMIEDEGQHCRTGSGLGHYFRGLAGQDMAGIDDIGGQVLPQGEDAPVRNAVGAPRSGTFYHYGLAKLAASAAAIDPGKHGNAMCEIFGNYGWAEGVRLEKYLADHFLVRGINYFVPHAFSAKAFPDPDCPPHFYAHGHNPQYRHFGAVCGYMNRAATLISSGRHVTPAAVLYHGEMEWADAEAMPVEQPIRALYDCQIDCHVLPADVFAEPDRYQTRLGTPFSVNGQQYNALIVPGAKYLPRAAADGLAKLAACGLPVLFVNRRPDAVAETGEPLPPALASCAVAALNELPEQMTRLNCPAPKLEPANDRMRVLHVAGETDVYLLANEGSSVWEGTATLSGAGGCFLYDAWENQCHSVEQRVQEAGAAVNLRVEPLKSVFIVFGEAPCPLTPALSAGGRAMTLSSWKRSICPAVEYPGFRDEKEIRLPDHLAEEQPEFSGFVRYETMVDTAGGGRVIVEISDAQEGVELFVNGTSAGLQVSPPFRYDISGLIREGENRLAVEVATTLERQCYPALRGYARMLAEPPVKGSGITGSVKLFQL